MLKLEKNSKNQDIGISVRKKERLLSRSFLIAFSIALALHLFAGFFFQIRSFKIFDSGSLIPPITVNASLIQEGEQDHDFLVKAQVEDKKKLNRYLLAPKKSIPQIPEVSIAVSRHQLEYNMDDRLLMNYFTDLEKEYDEQYLKTSFSDSSYPPIHINVSGKIAENSKMTLTSELQSFLQSQLHRNSPKPNVERHLFVYSILVEEKNGKIFWYEPKNLGSETHSRLAKKILNGIMFSPNKAGFVSSGEIEILAVYDD